MILGDRNDMSEENGKVEDNTNDMGAVKLILK